MAAQQEDSKFKINTANVGLNMDSTTSQIGQGEISWAMNAVIENFDGQKVNYSNEPANEFCCSFPEGYQPNGSRNIIEDDIIVIWLVNPLTGGSEFGVIENCVYTKKINSKCLGLDVNYPILKTAHFKTNCNSYVFWVDGKNRDRYIDLYNLPFKEIINGCDVEITDEVDCNKLNIQPDFNIPQIEITDVVSGGDNKTGTYQFTVQYANALKEPYTAYYSVTNPVSLFDTNKITPDFNYPVDKSIILNISNLDVTGLYDYINVAVIKTVNNISTVELVGNYQITGESLRITYSGNSAQSLNIDDVFQKYEIYDKSNDLTVAQDVLIRDQLTSHERISYQEIANNITLQWETYRIKGDAVYKNEENIATLKGYMRGEVAAVEFVPLLKNGKQCDGFHIPGRVAEASDISPISNEDTSNNILPTWKVYDTSSIQGYDNQYDGSGSYVGPYQYGTFSYWESSETYPCNDIYGSLQNQPIRHHKFPDISTSPHFDISGYIYPMGIRIDVQQVVDAINNSSLTQAQKDEIQGFKIVRADRADNKSIIAKGIINNVLKYTTNPGENTSGNSLSNSINDLIDSTISNINSTIDTMTFLRIDAKKELKDAIDHLTAAKLQDPRTQGFTDNVTIALNDVKDVRGRSNLDEKTKVYLDVDESLINAILETADAYSQIDETAIIDTGSSSDFYFPNYLFNDVSGQDSLIDNIVYDESSKSRFAFHSPDTHFYQPSIGDKLVSEAIIAGASTGHIVQVKNHSRYQFINIQAYLVALLGGLGVGFASATIGVSTEVFNGTAAFTAYQAMLDIIFKITPHKNYTYQYNAVGNYNQITPLQNKTRGVEIGYYLIPGVFNTGDDLIVNNSQRESSVYLKVDNTLPYTNELSSTVDRSKLIYPTNEEIVAPISSYYSSIRNSIPNQYGQLYSYKTIDTGYQKIIDLSVNTYTTEIIFGGDTFINKFAFKNKLPLFSDNRVAKKGSTAIDDSDISYNEIPNIGSPKYWFSTDITESTGVFNTIFGIKKHRFFWDQPTFFYDNGKIFLFAYGIPNFYVESAVNVDLRQAYNQYEGDFFPHVSNHIPDEWVQEYNVSINEDNTYYYNKTFSKQNEENFFSHLTPDFTPDDCTQVFPYRTIFSEPRTDNPNPSNRNNWLIYKPASRFDFPQNYGRLISLDGVADKQVYARFENKTLLYNALSTIPTSAGDAYLDKSLFNQQIPPLDLADTDLGYIGTQHKFFIKTEYGPIAIDAKRGQIFILNGNKTEELTSSKYKCQQFFTQNLGFSIRKSFPDINIDNHYNGIGLHGVYDARFNRMIITKLDYELINNSNLCYDGINYRDVTDKAKVITSRTAGGYRYMGEDNCKLLFEKDINKQILPVDTDIYAFFDATSMKVADGIVAASALKTWFAGVKQANPLYRGNLYIIPSDIEPPPRDQAEQYLRYLSQIRDGNPFLYSQGGWNTIQVLPPNFGGEGWAPVSDIILLAFVDEIDPGYHTNPENDFTGQPTTSFQEDYMDFKEALNDFASFTGILYPIPRPIPLSTRNAILQILAAVEGTTLNQAQVNSLHTVVDVSSILTTNPYEGFVMPDSSVYIPLKELGWRATYDKFSPAMDVFNSSTFGDDLNSLLNLGSVITETIKSTYEFPIVKLGDPKFFANKSFTFSFDFENMRWVSPHSYLPNFYLGNSNSFYAGNKTSLYSHLTEYTTFNRFFGEIAPYIIEYPISYKYRDELLQSIQDYTKVFKYNDYQEFIETDDVYFDETILYNNQQCSGVRKLSPKPRGSINTYLKYPIYNADNINILFTKSNNFYQYNTFWSVIKDKSQPIWKSTSNSPYKELNQNNMNYKKLSYQKAPLVAKDIKIRHCFNSSDQYKLISQFIVSESVQKY